MALSGCRPRSCKVDFQLTAQQRSLQEAARRFANEQLSDLAKELETRNTPVPAGWLQRYAELGFLGINIDDKYGGVGLGSLEALLVIEEFAKVSAAVAFPIFESCTGPVKAIEKFGAESLKERVIPRVCRGELIIAISMSEAEAGSAVT